MKTAIEHWNEQYDLPMEKIPWEIATPPHDLSALVEDHSTPTGGQALDVACGTGNYSRFLSSRGYRVTAIDFSPHALAVARSRNCAETTAIEYIEGDVTKLSLTLPADRRFDLILDYSLLHHLPPDAFARHTQQFASLLRPDARLLVVCYSDTNLYAKGQTSARGAFGNEMFYRTRSCIEKAYAPLRVLSYRETTLGKQGHHRGHSFVFGY
ncbi:class I SAM-dependent methyltransferase [Trinickia fusca]|uniref:Class I SAM-dependent methyltransferase n=1 Tax=Trinickia fusca TaxID=2419777 RepID=A0A494XCB8_9BURK|nr:class I SAM-dependent methyltransferase [Trinickia fusca]RKP48240.1 class I SAM-dependent methyltransferase [Trinickia fusca]